MQLQIANRKKSSIKMMLQGPSGSGKTMSALLVAYGLCNNWSKVAVIDTENQSAHLYANLGPYQVLNLTSPFSPEKYIEAITCCETEGIEVIILDSLTHEWEFLLEYHSSLPGNSFTNWAKVTPRHNNFLQRILHSTTHIIGTVRSKQDYTMVDKNGKMVPEKVGLKGIQRDGVEYEFTLCFELDIRNYAHATKDRTGLFTGKAEQKLTEQTGQLIADWCNRGADFTSQEISNQISDCSSIAELLSLYNHHPQFQQSLKAEFESRKKQILLQEENHHQSSH